jgi:hypothetical protein
MLGCQERIFRWAELEWAAGAPLGIIASLPFFSEFFSSSFLVEIILGKEKIKEREGLQRSNHI